MPSAYPTHLTDHVILLADSFEKLTGRQMIDSESPDTLAERIWEAPFALVSHGTEADPVFNYANRTALDLFEMSWREFTHLPSRLSAEPESREARDELLRRVSDYGYVDDYSGIRISAMSRRFVIRDAVVWNVIDRYGHYHGQAAMITNWSDVEEEGVCGPLSA